MPRTPRPIAPDNKPDLDRVIAAWKRAEESGDEVAKNAMLDAYMALMDETR